MTEWENGDKPLNILSQLNKLMLIISQLLDYFSPMRLVILADKDVFSYPLDK